MSQSTSNLLPTEKYPPVLPREPAWDAPPPNVPGGNIPLICPCQELMPRTNKEIEFWVGP